MNVKLNQLVRSREVRLQKTFLENFLSGRSVVASHKVDTFLHLLLGTDEYSNSNHQTRMTAIPYCGRPVANYFDFAKVNYKTRNRKSGNIPLMKMASDSQYSVAKDCIIIGLSPKTALASNIRHFLEFGQILRAVSFFNCTLTSISGKFNEDSIITLYIPIEPLEPCKVECRGYNRVLRNKSGSPQLSLMEMVAKTTPITPKIVPIVPIVGQDKPTIEVENKPVGLSRYKSAYDKAKAEYKTEINISIQAKRKELEEILHKTALLGKEIKLLETKLGEL